MGTWTAHIAVGDQNNGGIIPNHVAWLWENLGTTSYRAPPTTAG